MARRDPRHTEAIQRTLAEVAPVADGVLQPKWFEGTDDEPMLFGASVAETRAFAFKALERRMKVIGLVAAA
jgi:ribonucleoside-diphosphate reductase beta chain